MEVINFYLIIVSSAIGIWPSVMTQSLVTDPVVQSRLGLVRGSLMTTRLNKIIFAFRGVRYAVSPEGERRFEVPKPITSPWEEIFDATQEGSSCPRPEDDISGSEDCLRLNVYTTKLPDAQGKVNRPVVVYFHPGNFHSYSGQSYVFGPQYYLDQNVVLVTVNYRLGILGFISSGDARAPGNLGLKDQVIALRWVQENIAAFGGDPNSVTIAGSGSGAVSVILHMLSPMSKNLFYRAIAMSGSPTMPASLPINQKRLVLKQAKFVGCPNANLSAAIECLKKVPHQTLGKSIEKFREWYGDPLSIWSPVVEPAVPGVERFLTAQPVDLIRKKDFHHVPLMIGITKDEYAAIPLLAYERAKKGDETYHKNFTKKWYHAAPISFLYRGLDKQRRNYNSMEIYKFYFGDHSIKQKNEENLGQIYADALSGFPTHRAAVLFAEHSSAPVYNYMFSYQGRYSFATWNDTGKPYGIVNQDELQYLFYLQFAFPYMKEDDPEVAMVEKFTAIHASFAKTGHPIPEGHPLFKGVIWLDMKPSWQNYLNIGKTFKMKSRMYSDRYALWDRLFPLN